MKKYCIMTWSWKTTTTYQSNQKYIWKSYSPYKPLTTCIIPSFPWTTLFYALLCETSHTLQHPAYVSSLNEDFLDYHPPCYVPFLQYSSFFSQLSSHVFYSHFCLTLGNIPVLCVLCCVSVFPPNFKHSSRLGFLCLHTAWHSGKHSINVHWMDGPCTRGQAGSGRNRNFSCCCLVS